MSLKDAYQEKLEAQIEEQRARLELLKAKAQRAAADVKIMAYEEIGDVDAKLDALKGKLKELSSASGDAWQDMKSGVEKAWTDLTRSCEKAARRFNDER
jgi:hypothetical protein